MPSVQTREMRKFMPGPASAVSTMPFLRFL